MTEALPRAFFDRPVPRGRPRPARPRPRAPGRRRTPHRGRGVRRPGRPGVPRLPRRHPSQRRDVRAARASSTSTSPTACTGAPTSCAALTASPTPCCSRAGGGRRGLAVARSRRVTARSDDELARGPAGSPSALGLGREHDGLDLCRDGASDPSDAGRPVDRRRGGVRPAGRASRRAVETPWRFWVDGDPTVSPYRPGRLDVREDHSA